MITEIHPSSIARILKCGMSKTAPETNIDSSSEVARTGQAMHAVLADMIKQNLEARPDLKPYLKKFDISNEDELGFLVWSAFESWKEIRDDISVFGVEALGHYPIHDDYFLVGTTDLYGETIDNELVVLDWKSNQIKADTTPQLTAYAYLIQKLLKKEYESIKLITVWSRLQEFTIIDISSDDIEEFESELKKAIYSDKYVSGGHCLYCQHQYECEARYKMINGISNDLMIKDENQIANIVDLAKKYPQVKILEQTIREYKDIVKDYLKDNPKVLLDDGQYLGLTSRVTDKLVTDKAFKMICEELEIEVPEAFKTFKDSLSLNKAKALKLISDKAPQGAKASAKKAFIKKLKEADAMNTSESFIFDISGEKE